MSNIKDSFSRYHKIHSSILLESGDLTEENYNGPYNDGLNHKDFAKPMSRYSKALPRALRELALLPLRLSNFLFLLNGTCLT